MKAVRSIPKMRSGGAQDNFRSYMIIKRKIKL